MADDLRRFLEGLPVAARPTGPVTRSWRWCRRKPVQAALVVSLALSLIIGVTGITWKWREAERQKSLVVTERNQKEAERQKAEAINRFLIDKLLLQAAPAHNPDARTVTLRAALDHAAKEVSTLFQNQPQVEAAIQIALGQTYHELGEHLRSERHLRRALDLLSIDGAEAGRDRLQAMTELGDILNHLGRKNEAESLLGEAVEQTRRILGASDDTALLAACYQAVLYVNTGRAPQAQALLRRVLDDARHSGKSRCREALSAQGLLCTLLAKTDPAEAERLMRDIVKAQTETLGPRHPDTLFSLQYLIDFLCTLGRYEEAESLARSTLETVGEVLGAEHPLYFRCRYKLANILELRGRKDEAEKLYRWCLQTVQRFHGLGITPQMIEAQLKALHGPAR
jgi:eukaryotic-like serine/threonine-protein kinase